MAQGSRWQLGSALFDSQTQLGTYWKEAMDGQAPLHPGLSSIPSSLQGPPQAIPLSRAPQFAVVSPVLFPVHSAFMIDL